VVWRHPASAVIMLLGGVLLVEQFPVPGLPSWTDSVPLFTSLSQGASISGLYVNPVELFMGMVVVVWLMRSTALRGFGLPRSPLAAAMAVLLVLVAIAWVRGIGHGGNLTASLWELRPWLYLAIAYVLASQLLTNRRQLAAVLWTLVLVTGLKGLQGSYFLISTLGRPTRPDALLAHEEATFFGLYVALTVGLWLFGIRGRLRAVATLLLPAVVLADLGNHRRAAFPILGAAVLLVVVVAAVRLPERRRLIAIVSALTALAGAAYIGAFWNGNGTLAQPARALRSVISPDARDQLSNQYRVLENANLGLAIKHSVPLGQGFGVPIDYSIPITDISNVDTFIRYVPHDGILYVWMRMGVPGAVAFWMVIASALIAACALTRSRHRGVALLGALAGAAVVAHVIEGYYDLGLFWFREAIVVGALLGAVEAARRMEAAGRE
jgi:hypothetical protein